MRQSGQKEGVGRGERQKKRERGRVVREREGERAGGEG